MQPTTARPRPVSPPVIQPIRPRVIPGDRVCGNCGTGNDPTRKFCRSCGRSLAAAVIAPKVPWYRRIFRREKRALSAGQRPKGAGSGASGGGLTGTIRSIRAAGRNVFRILVPAIVILAMLGIFIVPSIRETVLRTVNDIIEQVSRFVKPEYIEILDIKAEGPGVKDHEAAELTDLNTFSYWMVDLAGNPNPSVQLTFTAPVDLAKLRVTNLPPGEVFTANARVATITIDYGDGTSQQITVENLPCEPQKSPCGQDFDLKGKAVATLRITVATTYPPGATGNLTLAELEFFRQK